VSTTVTTTTISQGSMGMKHIANYYKFNLGRAALKVKPGEAFNTKVTFPETLSLDVANNTNFYGSETLKWFVHCYIVGLSWQPL
jgi:hypothetical protein